MPVDRRFGIIRLLTWPPGVSKQHSGSWQLLLCAVAIFAWEGVRHSCYADDLRDMTTVPAAQS